MKELIVKIAVMKAREVLDKVNELDEYPDIKEMLLEALEDWLREKLGEV